MPSPLHPRVVHDCLMRHQAVALVLTVAVCVTGLAAAERMELLPLSGQTTPSYGPLPERRSEPSVIETATAPADRSTRAEARRAARLRERADRAAAPQQPATPPPTPRRDVASLICEANNTSGCAAMLQAFAEEGNMTCLASRQCSRLVDRQIGVGCSGKRGEEKKSCERISLQRWIGTVFLPEECAENDRDCAEATTFLVDAQLPTTLGACLQNIPCRQLLAETRWGGVGCYRYHACRDALRQLIDHDQCGWHSWCSDLARLHENMAEHYTECPAGSLWCSLRETRRYMARGERPSYHSCIETGECHSAMLNIETAMRSNPNPVCVIWEPCLSSMQQSRRWACETVRREPNCRQMTNLLQFYLSEYPQCVELHGTSACQKKLEEALR